MAKVPIPIVGGNGQHESIAYDSQQTINMFPERAEKGAKSGGILRLTPGIELFTTLTLSTGPIRVLYATSNDRFFIVRGYNLYESDTDGNLTLRGLVVLGIDAIRASDNGLEMLLQDGTNIWRYDFTAEILFQVLSNPGVSEPPSNTPVIEFIDGYFFGFDPTANNGVFQHSNLNDGDTWDPLDKYTAEGSPDKIVTLKAHNRQLWIFGSKSFEVWYNKGGGVGDTWARIMGTFTNIGCAAQYSVSTVRDSIIWLGSSKDGEHIVWMCTRGYVPVQISDRGMESTLSGFTTISDAISYTYEYEGHFLYVLTFPTDNKTFMYDLHENEWVTWAYRDPTTGLQGRHRATASAYFNRTNYVGDYENGNVYSLSRTKYTDNGDPIVRERYFSHIHANNNRVSMYSVFFDVLTGMGLLSGQGSDPKLQIRWAKDGGRTYGNWHQIGIGARGKYNFQVIKRMIGIFRVITFHIRTSEPVPFSIQDNCFADIKVSNS